MAGYTPTSLSLDYKKSVGATVLLNNISFKFDLPSSGINLIYNHEFIGLPTWLEVLNVSSSFGQFAQNKYVNFDLRIKPSVAEALFGGGYYAQIYVKFKYQDGSDFKTYTDNIGFNVSLTVKNTVFLSIGPTPCVFNYVVGASLPSNKLFQITSGRNWFISTQQTWVNLAAFSGVGNSALSVGVDPSGLPVGSYESIVSISDNVSTREAVVILSITEGDTESKYLHITPRNFEFISEFEVANLKEMPISLDVSDSWTATPSAAWLVVSETSGVGGIHDLTVSVDSLTLAVGVYTGTITFQSDDIIKKVYIILKVLEFYTQGIESNNLYFADDRNTLEVSATTDNTFLLLDTITATGLDNIPYEQEAPYMQGVASVLIGLETNDLMPLVTPPVNLTTRIQNNLTPINISFTAFNVNKLNDAIAKIAEFQNLYFINGKTPKRANKLCYIPSEVNVTNKAVLSLSILTTIAPSQISISGDVDAVISGSVADNKYVYNAIVNLSSLGLVAGNSIVISFGSLSVTANIKDNEPEENLIGFENEWREIELFPTTGWLTKTPNINETQSLVATDGREHTKIVKIDYGVEYTLNTGFILSQDEMDWLATMLKAKRKYFYEDGEAIEIIFTTKKLEIYETRRNYNSYNLIFKRAIV